ncbi:TIM-barrel domain-containing protein [Micromonospora sp. BRA006-A]|nr:TIM-barrel domain-containing protein [Micromonospora sp. BRA006-A]
MAPGDERFVGFGEKFTPLDKRGQRPLMWNFDAFGGESDRSHKNVPFYLSDRGYGVLVDSGLPVQFDVCASTHSSVQILVPDDLLDYYVLAGPTPERVLDRLDALTGRPYLPPRWAFGAWISSGFFPDTQQRVLERARRIRERDIPCDVLHLDCYWQVAGHWSDLRWDADAFPDPDGMLKDLTAQGFRVCLWMNPYLMTGSPLYADAEAPGTSCAARTAARTSPTPGTAATRNAPSWTSRIPQRCAGSRACCGRCWRRASRRSRPTSPRAYLRTRSRTTA